MPDVVYLQFGVPAVAGGGDDGAVSGALAGGPTRVSALQEVRQRLVAEAMQADDRHNRELAEHLHDGPLQTLLAARLELDEVRERNPDPALDLVYSALQDTAKGLRSTVTELHPQVLAQLGLDAGGARTVAAVRVPWRLVDAELEDVGKPASQTLMYRAARELLANINKHARATDGHRATVRRADRIVMTVADDGTGFDPASIDQARRRGAHRARLAAGALRRDGRFDRHRLRGRRGHAGDRDLAARGRDHGLGPLPLAECETGDVFGPIPS